MRRRLLILGLVISGAAVGCGVTMPREAFIAWQTDAPFCGNMRVERTLDGNVVARDTLKSGVATASVSVRVGLHIVGAKVLFLDGRPGTVYTWADTTYVLNGGDRVTRVLPLYCS